MSHHGTHDPLLVAFSILIATLASYTALDLGGRIKSNSGTVRLAWLCAAAVTMGGGIWSMHFVAMLAFHVPGVAESYDVGLTLLSLLLPIAVTGIGFHVASRPGTGAFGLRLSGVVMGLGIAIMHYVGMGALRAPAVASYDPWWVALSLLIAISAANIATELAFANQSIRQRAVAAAVMGIAIAGMHYVAMQGTTFAPHVPDDPTGGVAQTHLAIWITATTLLILAMALVAAMFDRHFSAQATREAVALRESEERFRRLVDSVTDYAIFMLDETGHVSNWNEGARRIKGYEAGEILGRHFSVFYPEEDRAAGVPDRALATAAREGKFEIEGWRLRRDGARFWASVVIDPVYDDSGRHVGFAKITRDITEQRRAMQELDRAREALWQAQKMEALGQLTGGVAHDFNNLLMAVSSSLELLRKRLPPDPRTRALLDNALLGTQRGSALTQRMLAFARRQNLAPVQVHLGRLIVGMRELLQQSGGPYCQIEVAVPETLPTAFADPHQLELAILNLCVNARDAMPGGGTITIAGHSSEDEDGRRYVVVSVSDTGVGMDPETLAKAHEPFFTTKGVGKGTGLGLSMVHGLAEQSKGRLVLQSTPGAGTTAEIWLPVCAADAKPEHASELDRPVPAPRGPALTVLVVDDDQLVLESAASMVEDLGHTAVRALNAAAALEQVDRAVPDVVLADHLMPELTGLQLVRRLRSRHPGLPCILMTGFAELDEAHGVPTLSKPFDQTALARVLTAAMHLASAPVD